MKFSDTESSIIEMPWYYSLHASEAQMGTFHLFLTPWEIIKRTNHCTFAKAEHLSHFSWSLEVGELLLVQQFACQKEAL